MTTSEIHDSLVESAATIDVLFEAPADVLARTYGPGKWSIREVLVHLADAEFVYLWRVSRAIAEPGSAVEGFDQDLWAAKLGYGTRSLPVARDLFVACRNQLLEHVSRATQAQLQHTVEHSEAGPIVLLELLTGHARHAEHHLEQIAAAQEGRMWLPAGVDAR
jgi:hypothetical protein